MKAIALVSGGLDSTLAVKLIKDQGIEITALNFKTPFCLCDRKSASGCLNHSRKLAEDLGIDYKMMNITEEFFQVISRPKHGYGSNMNPCIDCRILKFLKAKDFMRSNGASFIITGEVLGQRPMSQHRRALDIIDKESGLEGLVLRPLSAKLLPETLPEKEGWVERKKLLAFNGRERRPQMDLAEKFGIKDYPCPAGGCLLTDSGFAKRLKDLLSYEKLEPNSVELLKLGRYFALGHKIRLVVGRNEAENQRLADLAKEGDHLFMPTDTLAGPTALGRGEFNTDLIKLACSIICRYCDLNGALEAEIICKKIGDSPYSLKVFPLDETALISLRI